jgi:serine/threonine protein kinase
MKEGSFSENYEEQELIGTGTYGVVHRGVQKATGTKVAIKRIKNIDDGEGLPTTTIREISILKNLDHQHIVRLLDVSLEAGEGCTLEARLIFERAEQDLAKYLNQHHPLS